MDNRFTLYAFAMNAAGQFEQIANEREWIPGGTSRSISDRFTGKIYGKGKKGWAAAQADVLNLNRDTRRPA